MTRSTAAVIAVGSALALSGLTGCSSHSHSSAAGSATTGSTSSSSSAQASTSASTSPAATSSAGASTPASSAASSAASSTPATTVPATATSPGSTPAATTSATSAGSSTRCRNAQLKVSLGPEGAAAGNRYTPLIFTNTGSTSCTLAGHPGVSYVAGDMGVKVGDSAKRDPGTVQRITLAPGRSASALLHEANYQNFDQSVCKPVTVRGFRVYPPGSKAAFFVPRPARECSGTNLPATALSIGVVKPGTDPSA